MCVGPGGAVEWPCHQGAEFGSLLDPLRQAAHAQQVEMQVCLALEHVVGACTQREH